MTPRPKVLLILPTATYRAPDFLEAAEALEVDVVVACEATQTMADVMRSVTIDLCDLPAAAAAIATGPPVDAVVGVDEQGVEVAALAAAAMRLKHNPPSAVALTRDKAALRHALTAAGLPQPAVGQEAGYPCVVKATGLSGSRGVIRADSDQQRRDAVRRVEAILSDTDGGGEVLIESFVPGAEVAVEGLLDGGRLTVLAIFDKPDPLDGPFFEETLYVTPSRHGRDDDIATTVAAACRAVGLREGPVHAEVRLGPDGPVLLEVAARSIGGLCSRALRFGAGISLEEVILRHALDLDRGELVLSDEASGVMMIPIPTSGTLRSVGGQDEARRVEGVVGLELTVPIGQRVVALPEGDRYLGFIFATGPTPRDVEASLRAAHRVLDVDIG